MHHTVWAAHPIIHTRKIHVNTTACKTLTPLIAAAFGLTAAPLWGQSLTIDLTQTDTSLNDNFDEVWIAETRAGNLGASGDWEIGFIVPPPANQPEPGQQSNVIWENGVTLPWFLMYDATIGEMSYGIGTGPEDVFGIPITVGVGVPPDNPIAPDSFDAIAFRVRGDTGTRGGDIEVNVTGFNGGPIPDPPGVLNLFEEDGLGSAVEIITVSGFDDFDEDGFSFTGNVTFSWDEATQTPDGSRVAFQIKGLQSTGVVPEPGAYAAIFGAVAFGFVLLRRRFNKRA